MPAHEATLPSPGPEPGDDGQDLRAQLRADLMAAMRARETEVVGALRSAIAAVENAEAVAPDAGRPPSGSAHFAGAAYGPGATEARRRAVTADQVRALIAAQVVGRAQEAEHWAAIGRHDRAQGLRNGLVALRKYLPDPQ